MGKCDILHYITRSSFTSGYIDFMKIHMSEYQHFFITTESDEYPLNTINNENIYVIEDLSDLVLDDTIIDLIHRCEKFIVSGVFGIHGYLISFNELVLKKVYLHFWGGDFYGYRNCSSIDSINDKDIMNRLINKCHGIINLIPYEYKELQKVFPIIKKNFVAPMPNPPIEIDKYIKCSLEDKKTYKILIGNSATAENHHLETFNLLSSKELNDVEIYSPLSYGDKEYKAYVIRMGKTFFGERFYSLNELLPFDKYMRFLSTCDVGIFNNDRQQAMGNITFMLGMGKKVYLRNGTSMWYVYKQRGFKIFDIDEIRLMSINDIVRPLKEYEKRKNNSLVKKYLSFPYQENAWRQVFDDINIDIACSSCCIKKPLCDVNVLSGKYMHHALRASINKRNMKKFFYPMLIYSFGRFIAALINVDIQNVLLGRPPMLIENNFWKNLRKKDQKYVLFGTGENGEGCYRYFMILGMQKRIIGFIDNNVNKLKKLFHGIPISAPRDIVYLSDVKVVITSTAYEQDMKNQLEEMGCEKDKIVIFREMVVKDYQRFLTERFPMIFHHVNNI